MWCVWDFLNTYCKMIYTIGCFVSEVLQIDTSKLPGLTKFWQPHDFLALLEVFWQFVDLIRKLHKWYPFFPVIVNYFTTQYGFCNKTFKKDEPLWPVKYFYNIFVLTELYSAITLKSEHKCVVKVFNWSEVHLSEMTCYKIHTLVEW